VRALKRIAGFVAVSLLDRLQKSYDLDRQEMAEIRRKVRQRIAEESPSGSEEDAAAKRAAAVDAAHRAGRLDDAFVQEAVAAGDRPLTLAALARASGLGPEIVRRMLASRSGKAVAALSWQSGMSMRTALALQHFAPVAARDILPARDGVDYPLPEEELRWQIDYFLSETGL
jgi:hypothetical protein